MTVQYPSTSPVQPQATSTPPSGAPKPRLTFLGCGYLGSTYAACFAELGYEVLGVDIDEAKIAKLSAGENPIHEPGLDELLKHNLESGRLKFTTSYAEAAEFGDVHFICVDTPQRADGEAADLSYVESVVTTLAPHLTRRTLIVGKSTVPVGTANWVEELACKHAPDGVDVQIAWSPEFLREGFACEDVLRPNRVVFGVKSDWARQMLYASHKALFELAATEDREVPVVVTDYATAELVKVAANAFLATKISFINAMAEVCEAAGADVTLLAKSIGYDSRIGNKFLRAGIGFGGGCLPKDIRAFQARAQEIGAGEALRFLHEVDLVNQRRRNRVLALAADLLDRPLGPAGPDLAGAKIAVLGAAFKPNTDDVRNSPGLAVAKALAKANAEIVIYDPEATKNAHRELPDVEYVTSLTEAVTGADLTCVVTAWDEFRRADPHAIGELANARRIIDGMNCLDHASWIAAGWDYRGMGRPIL
ncbi:UDP-glucose dehydrogenase family protein [Actinocatenispora thailandica]|uniref:UDP-glucose dehydrogenase family protein n=1 Tax=Actinocatenispora thailandica TaxID=227318 RepID=UPI00195057E3|nr:UDP-glucose/GDP-mannose dehydrogenase family protein [Actinocatenispora thailandica]